MRVLVIGGSGHVGKLVVPRLLAAPYRHSLTLFDRRRPAYPLPDDVVFREGDATSVADLDAVAPGHEAILYLAMGAFKQGDPQGTIDQGFDVNTKAVWVAAGAAVRHEVGRFVYASSLSIYEDPFIQPMPSEEEPRPDALSLYGITKKFGEDCVQRFVQRSEGKFSGFSLRLCFPVETAEEVARIVADGKDCALTANETARAFSAALTAPVPPGGYAPVFIVGARAAHRVNLARAKRLLDWAPDPIAP